MGKVLIVDDENIAIKGLTAYVNWKRCKIETVYTAMTANKAKALLQEHEIDLMISDIEMPMGSGIELLEWAKIYKPGLVCIFLSSHADFDYAKEAVRLGAFLYLLKPSPIEEIEEALLKGIEEAKRKKLQMDLEESRSVMFSEEGEGGTLEKAIAFIWEHLSSELSREEVAAQAFLSPDYMSKLFKKETGLTFHEYVMSQRITMAKRLLKDSRKNIQEISGAVGFNSVSYFIKQFKKETGKTPREFREEDVG